MEHVAQKWLALMGGLGALVIVVANPTGFFRVAQSLSQIVGGTTSTIITPRGK